MGGTLSGRVTEMPGVGRAHCSRLRKESASSISISIACSSGWVELNVGVGLTKDIMDVGEKT